MHHQPLIAFDIARIVRVIVNAMPVAGERRIAEQQSCIERNLSPIHLIRPGHRALWGIRTGRWILAIDEVLPFGQAKGALLPDLVAQGDKSQWAAASGLLRRVFSD